jgi:20S proteasome subunit beta 2
MSSSSFQRIIRLGVLLLGLGLAVAAAAASGPESSFFSIPNDNLRTTSSSAEERGRPSTTRRARIETLLFDEKEADEWSLLDRRPSWEDDLGLGVPTHFGITDHQNKDEGPIQRKRAQSPSSVSLHLQSQETTNDLQETTARTPDQLQLRPRSFSNNHHSSTTKSKFKKTGTTIAGCCVDGHVILAADTRATEDTMVADKTCQKLHPLARNSWCAGAGTSADLDHLTKHCLYSLALQRLQEGSIGNAGDGISGMERLDDDDSLLLIGSVSMEAVCHFLQDALYSSSGLGANLIVGGVWQGEAYLRAIHPHGSMDVDLPFCALGSGGLAAMGVLERDYRSTLSVPEAIELVQAAIVAGIRNDLGSGSQVDLCVISPDGTSRLERCVVPEEELEVVVPTATEEEAETTTTEPGVNGNNDMGVNGFGNLPFSVKSRKVRLETNESELQLSQWDDLLGLTKNPKANLN